MQNKGAIKVFAIAFAVVCLFQLSFTFFTSRVEKKAKEYAQRSQVTKLAKQLANGSPVKEKMLVDSIAKSAERYYLDSIAEVGIYNILVKNYTYKECKDREINLGLDLKGGMNVTLEVSVVDVIRAMSGYSKDKTFNRAIALASEMQKNSQDDYVTLFGKAFNQIDPNAKLAAIFSTRELKDKITFASTNEEVLKIISEQTNAAIDNTFNILRTRIDKFGVAQPNIQKLQTAGRILVELPGIKEPERVRKLLQGTAKLEFWETFEFSEVYSFFAQANKKNNIVEDTLALKNDSLKANTETKLSEIIDTTKNKSLVDKISDDTSKKAAAKTKDEKSFEEYAKENPLFAYLNPPFQQDEKGNRYPAKGPVVGFSMVKDTARVNHFLAQEHVKSIFPRNLKLLWTNKPDPNKYKGNVLELIAIKVPTDGRAPLEGDAVTDARQDFGNNNSNEISMSMNSQGAKIWKRMTGENVNKAVAIVLDDYVYSFPNVLGEIPTGRTSITGNFSLNEAKDLANVLKAGKLPAPAHIVEEAVVGPSIGKEAINAGLISFIVAFIMVLLYMALYYNKGGIVANVALLCNVFFIFGVLASLGATLTLPGIAGIVLTLGMAVDANVIIFERIREELRAGKMMRLAIDDGFKNAYSAIIDGNVTTLLTGVILFIFGSGPVQGFATTLIIGILTSLFSAIFISRLIFIWMLNRNHNITFDNKITRNAFSKVNIDFIGIRKKLYLVSAAVIAIGIGSLVYKGLNLGVDFSGGRTYVVRFDKDVKSVEVRNSLTKTLGEAPEVKIFGPDNQVKITTKYKIEDNTNATDSIVESKIFEGVKSFYSTTMTYKDFTSDDESKVLGRLSSQKVGPTIADDIKFAAVLAIFFSLIGIFLYIFLRFRKWQYGLGGVVSLFHDTLVVISMYSIFYGLLPFSLEVDQAFIAAILTIIGYSINDTVIIFDRIREYNVLYPKRELNLNINQAINSTLGRTFNTAGTTLVTLLVMFIFGGEVIRGMMFALLVGIGVGTYSSIFNATPVAYDFIMMSKRRKEAKEAKLKLKK